MQVQIDKQRHDFEKQVTAALIEGDFQGRLHAYEDLVVEYQICLAAVDARLDQIVQWESFYDQLALVFYKDDRVSEVVEELHRQLSVNLPPLDESKCVEPVKPTRPGGQP
jgi:hypothetical protein